MTGKQPKVVVVGAGIAGLVSALELARQGCSVTVCEKAVAPGGKMRTVSVGGRDIDSGPTVFTMRWVFEQIFEAAGTSLEAHVGLKGAEILARHAWAGGARLDLFSDVERSADAIAEFADPAEALRFREFCARARATYETLEKPFILSPQPSPMSLVFDAGLSGFGDLWRISPFSTLWSTLGSYFHDPRLRQLFGRYATYCGSSPFECPATLMLVAHVEREGVWLIEGGMSRLAIALEGLAKRAGANMRYRAVVGRIATNRGRVSGVMLASGEHIAADVVVVNADAAAVTAGLFGREVEHAVYVPRSSRSLSAITWSMLATADGFPLVRHNVVFSDDYEAEFSDIFRRDRLPRRPTTYVCAMDRDGSGSSPGGAERLLLLVNAPPVGDQHDFDRTEVESCFERTLALLGNAGLKVSATPDNVITTTPTDFNHLFPGTGGALYGQASHGWTASFSRPTARTSIPGLYLAGGSVHPGPGVPMAAISGRLAAARVLADLASMRQLYPAAMPGGTSTQ
jgi:1-hydroxycarotenoid 3,4-desaturase